MSTTHVCHRHVRHISVALFRSWIPYNFHLKTILTSLLCPRRPTIVMLKLHNIQNTNHVVKCNSNTNCFSFLHVQHACKMWCLYKVCTNQSRKHTCRWTFFISKTRRHSLECFVRKVVRFRKVHQNWTVPDDGIIVLYFIKMSMNITLEWQDYFTQQKYNYIKCIGWNLN